MTERARRWFLKAVIGAAGVSVITVSGWFIATHISLISENREQAVRIADHEDTIKAQWGVIARLQESNNKLSIQVGTLTTIQREVIIPTLRKNHGTNIHYDIPLLPNIDVHVEPDLEIAPEYEEETVDPENFGREQTEINGSVPRIAN